MLVLEDAESAAERGADVLGRAHRLRRHRRCPSPDRPRAGRATAPRGRSRLALRDAGTEPGEVDYVNAHGTSTPLNDRSETEAIKRRFGDRARTRSRSRRLKSAIGHLLGAAGAVEAVATVLALRDAVAPPTMDYEEPDEGLDLDYVPGESRPHRAATAARRSGSRTRSGSAATTRSSAWRRRNDDRRRATPGGRRGRAPAAAEVERLTPLERLEALCDPGSFRALRSGVVSARAGERALPGDGVLAGAGQGRRPAGVLLLAGPRFHGRLARARRTPDSIVRVMRLAGERRRPGRRLRRVRRRAPAGGPRGARRLRADLPRERRALGGCVPQISVVTGVSAGGGAYSPALTDFVVMTERARMFLTGPRVVREALGEEVSMEELGGPRVHARNGVCQLVAGDERTARARRASCSRCLPDALGEPRPAGQPGPVECRPGGRRSRRRARASTTSARSIAAIVDGGDAARALGALGAQHGHRASPASTAARSAWSPTSRGGSAA